MSTLLTPSNTTAYQSAQKNAWIVCGAILVQLLALWPNWHWMSARMRDGSDDPLGVLALFALAVLCWQQRKQLRSSPWIPGLLLAAGFTILATMLLGNLPPLFIGIIAMLALASTLLAFLPSSVAKPPVVGLAILALPLLSSLQFYAGYPLRIVTAEVSRWLLQAFYEVQREGSALQVDGQLIIVDAPCSGVQMAWLGYFTACAIALWAGLNNRQFLVRLPMVGGLVLLGNIMRNSVLVAWEAKHTMPSWLHEGIGLVFLAAVCLGIAYVMRAPAGKSFNANPSILKPLKSSILLSKGYVAVLIVCGLWAGVAMSKASTETTALERPFVEWPQQWEGRMLRPLALSDVEQRFAQGFPGAITRMTDGRKMLVLRQVNRATRMLHPATDCYKGLGYAISHEQLEHDSQQKLWRCFIATRNGVAIRVCERIEDAQGQGFTDTSAWYWAALQNSSAAPWLAITTAEAVAMP